MKFVPSRFVMNRHEKALEPRTEPPGVALIVNRVVNDVVAAISLSNTAAIEENVVDSAIVLIAVPDVVIVPEIPIVTVMSPDAIIHFVNVAMMSWIASL
jgi:hypothetical protein